MAGRIARSRGAVFVCNDPDDSQYGWDPAWRDEQNSDQIALNALNELTKALGYKDNFDYQHAPGREVRARARDLLRTL